MFKGKIFMRTNWNVPDNGQLIGRRTGTFKVRCLHDDRDYIATFLTSEVDKVIQDYIFNSE